MSRSLYPTHPTVLLTLLALAVAGVFVASANAQSNGRQSGQASLPIHVVAADDSVSLGQEAVETERPGLFDRMKRAIANWANDHESDEEVSGHRHEAQPRPQISTATPVRPPRPMRVTDVQSRAATQNAAGANPTNTSENRSRNTQTRTESPLAARNENGASSRTPAPAPINDNEEPDDEETIHRRLEQMREQVFSASDLESSLAQEMRQARPDPAPTPRYTSHQSVTQTTPTPVRRPPPPPSNPIMEPSVAATQETVSQEFMSQETGAAPMIANHGPDNVSEPIPLRAQRRPTPVQTSQQPAAPPAPPRNAGLSGIAVDKNYSSTSLRRKDTPWGSTVLEPSPVTAVTPKVGNEAEPADTLQGRRMAENPQEYSIVSRKMLATDAGASTVLRSGGKSVTLSPRLEVETESSPRAIVGQEAEYRIRVTNRGDGPAEQVVLAVEIPDWLEIRQPDVSDGTTSIVPRSDGDELRDFNWKLSRIEPADDALLVLRLVPKQRKSIDLKIRYDFFRPAAVTKLVVQEPVLELELKGPDDVLWGTRVGYRLLVRNTGNGEAENVKLELLQTGSDMKSCELPLLKAGEEQVIDVDVWTGKQEYIDINIQASALYDLSAKVSKRVNVMRPDLVMTMNAPSSHFVGNPAEFVVHVRNNGNAAARDVELVAALPLGSQFMSCSDGGAMTSENQVVWKIDSIPVGELFTATVICEPKREGVCAMEAAVNDKSGKLASCSSAFDAAAIVQLKLDVETPQGPVEVGREAVYTLNIENRGTKAAENVDITVFFAKHLEPFAIEGGTAYTNDGQVVFDKIPTIGPEQHLTLKVKARADASGNHRVRSEVVCSGAEISLVNEQATYFYDKAKNTSTASSQNADADKLRAEKPASPVTRLEGRPVMVEPIAPLPTQPAPAAPPKSAANPPAIPALITPEIPVAVPAEVPVEPKKETPTPEASTLVDPFLQR